MDTRSMSSSNFELQRENEVLRQYIDNLMTKVVGKSTLN